jgi:multicomponent Na+:H+ antiporter subunit D
MMVLTMIITEFFSSLSHLPPFLALLIGAFAALLLRGFPRALVMLTMPIVGALHLWTLAAGTVFSIELMGLQLQPVRIDALSLLFGYLFHLAAFIAVVYSLHIKDTTQHIAGLAYASSAVGAVFAGDLLTLFVFWELLALTSVFLIWARRTEKAYASGIRYVIFQVFSGVLLLAGLLMLYFESGSLLFEKIGLHHSGLSQLGALLIFAAFGIKCAFPFVHNWLVDAYPEATPTGTIFLSAFTTKVAVYALARGYPGTEALIWIGAAMTCFPIFYAVIENDLRRVLAYSMINQIGFMVVGVGIGTELALNGAVAHAFNDVLFKGLLMMSMGAVLHMTGRMNGSDLGGLYKSMPITTVLCIVGAASISAFPLFSGFVSKSMIMAAAIQEGYGIVWLMLLFASAGVFHHAGIKIPYFAFFAHDSGIRTSDPPKNMLLAMAMAAFLCVLIGSFPNVLYQMLPYEMDYWPFDLTHVLTQLQLLFYSALAFVWLNLRGMYPPELRSANIDSDWLYRKFAPGLIKPLVMNMGRLRKNVEQRLTGGFNAFVKAAYKEEGTQNKGYFSKLWPTETMVIWVAVLLAGYLLLYYW